MYYDGPDDRSRLYVQNLDYSILAPSIYSISLGYKSENCTDGTREFMLKYRAIRGAAPYLQTKKSVDRCTQKHVTHTLILSSPLPEISLIPPISHSSTIARQYMYPKCAESITLLAGIDMCGAVEGSDSTGVPYPGVRLPVGLFAYISAGFRSYCG